jgi:DNA transposition AAA+ family ATPase
MAVTNLDKKAETLIPPEKIVSGATYETIDFQSVQKLCKTAQKHKLMIGLLGDTGLGKSTSLNIYQQDNTNVFRVTVDKTMNAKCLFLHILDCLGVHFNGNIHDVMLKIAETLNNMENPLLIVDEAGKMNHVMMLYMHDLREYTKQNCGIVLAGMPYFKANLQKFAQKEKEGCSEFFRRINLWHKLSGLSRKEIQYICTEEGINEPERIKELYKFTRFGDLMNEILLNKIIEIR